MEELKQNVDEMLNDVYKKMKKEKETEKREALRKELFSLIQCRKEITEVINLEQKNLRENEELALKIERNELEKNHPQEAKEMSKEEIIKLITGIVTVGGSIATTALGFVKLGLQDKWIRSSISYEQTGAFSTKTTGNIINSATKI